MTGASHVADDLWLTGHDSVSGKRKVAERHLLAGLGAALLAELSIANAIDIVKDRLYLQRNKSLEVAALNDPALDAILGQLADLERPQMRQWRAVQDHRRSQRQHLLAQQTPQPPLYGQPPHGQARQPRRRPVDGQPRHSQEPPVWPLPVYEQPQHRHEAPELVDVPWQPPAHDLREFIKFLIADGRAGKLVVERLSRRGVLERRKRWWGEPQYRPYHSNVSGGPASRLSGPLRYPSHRQRLSPPDMVLAGLVFATGLHHQAFEGLGQDGLAALVRQIEENKLPQPLRELLRTTESIVVKATMAGRL